MNEIRHASARAQVRLVDAVIRSLLAHGVEAAVLSPGYRNAPLSLALWQSSVRTHTVVDERSAAFVALGLARASGNPVVLCCTSGSALGHYLPAVIEASQTGTPLLVLSADRPFELSSVGAPQAIPQRGALAPYVAHEDEITCSAILDDDVPASADPAETRLAIALAALERGPVHLNVPLRKPLDPPEPRPRPEADTRRVFASQPTLSPAALDRLRRSAAQAKRPVIIDGPSFAPWGSQRPSAAAALAEATGWPLVADVLSTSRTHAASVPHADLLLRSERVRQALRPDFALWFGRAPISKWVLTWLAESGATAFAINPAAQWTDPSHTVAAVMQGRAEGVLALRDELPRASTAWQAAWRTTSSALQPVVASATTPMDWDGAVVRHALQAWKGRWAFVGNSLSIRDADALLHRSQARMLCNRGANGIDGTIATAWGHAWAHDEPGLVVLGDVTFEHDVGSLHQLPYDRPLTIVVVDNGGGRIFEQLPIRSQPGFREVFVTPSERSAVKTGQAAGLEAQDLQGREALQAAIAEAAGSRRPRVIRVQVDAEHSRQRRAAMVADCVAATEDALS